MSYSLLAGGVVRLGTGVAPSADVPLSLGSGDGQTDLEGRALGRLTLGPRIGLAAGAVYGVQRPRTITRRIAPPATVFAPLSSRQVVRWSPSNYWGLEAQPLWRVSEALGIAVEYRFFKKGEDTYEAVSGSSLPSGLDPSVLASGSGFTRQEIGIALTYETLAPWRRGSVNRLLQLHGRLSRAVSGSGGRAPATTRVEFGVRLFRRFWGGAGPPPR